ALSPLDRLLSFSKLPRPPNTTFFPYTTLFRSNFENVSDPIFHSPFSLTYTSVTIKGFITVLPPTTASRSISLSNIAVLPIIFRRSEEHTSELQSRENLVCRLLLEKKNKKKKHK